VLELNFERVWLSCEWSGFKYSAGCSVRRRLRHQGEWVAQYAGRLVGAKVREKEWKGGVYCHGLRISSSRGSCDADCWAISVCCCLIAHLVEFYLERVNWIGTLSIYIDCGGSFNSCWVSFKILFSSSVVAPCVLGLCIQKNVGYARLCISECEFINYSRRQRELSQIFPNSIPLYLQVHSRYFAGVEISFKHLQGLRLGPWINCVLYIWLSCRPCNFELFTIRGDVKIDFLSARSIAVLCCLGPLNNILSSRKIAYR